MRHMIRLILTVLLFGCTTPVPYAWLDMNQQLRKNATGDLDDCRAYAARQYHPGVPAGEPYLTSQTGTAAGKKEDSFGEWRSDRSPFPATSINAQPVHKVPVSYTGYPGEFDYYPGYLDDILEKCMFDRGWSYQPVKNGMI